VSTDLFERYGRLDPVSTEEGLGGSTWSTTVLLDVIDERNGELQTQQRVSETPKKPTNRWGLAVAAAAFAAVLLLGALAAIQFTGDDTVEPANATTTEAFDREAAETQALAVAEAYEAASAAGDVATLTAMQAVQLEEDRQMFEFNAALGAAGYGVEPGGCEVVIAASTLVRVECVQVRTDPVLAALGMEVVTAPLDVYPDGTVRWQPLSEGPGVIGEALVEYLERFHESEYQAVCSPAAYPPGSVVDNNRLALTAACGELVALHVEAIADWIEAGNFSG
jgi:hypothetical protein